jgi:hypothetical protein
VRQATGPARARRSSGSSVVHRTTAVLALLWSGIAGAQLAQCRTDDQRIAAALARIQRAIDPCGESAQLREVVDRLDRCGYQICTSTDADRNFFDRPLQVSGEDSRGTITWNPELRSALEDACDGDRTRALRRDPTASLLHELVHAGQECAGLNPGEHELEAVRIENIYRRAAGLCQRTGYGDTRLPPEMVKTCRPEDPPAAAPSAAPSLIADGGRTAAVEADARRRSGDRPE